MARILNEITSRGREIFEFSAPLIFNDPFRVTRNTNNLYSYGKRLRAIDDLTMPPIKRRRVTRRARRTRRYAPRFKRAQAYSSAKGNVITTGKAGKKRSHRAYINNLYSSTNFREKYRSVLTREGTISASNAGTTADVTTQAFIPLDFYGINGFTGQGTFNDTGDIIVRGGESKLMLHNDMIDPLNVTVYEIWFKETDSAAFPVAPDAAWDPTLLEGWYRDFKLINQREFNIREQDVVTLKRRIRPFRTNMEDWAAGNKRMYWVIKTYNPAGTTGGNLRWHISHNLSFVADHN